ncbi:MAG: DNA polymerase I [Pseudomonadales bacterium]|nr:DNA polymerase I [Pseudomonadales bacterium]
MQDHYQLVLIDGSSYLFRAFHALPPLTTSKGQPTGAIKGVISMIRKLMSDFPDSHIACVFDAKGKSFRNDIYPDYKANRAAMPDDLRSQIAPIHEIIKLMGVPLLMVDGVEADDVIGTLADQASHAGMSVLVSTGDKDMAQLVNDHVTLINTMNDAVFDSAGVVEKFGVRPDQIIDYLALVGDTSDNIPGVPKCGPKTAIKWLTQYQSLAGVIENADDVSGKVGDNLRASLLQLPMAYELATIKRDVSLENTVEDLKLLAPDNDGLLALFTELEFKPWIDELAKSDQLARAENPANYQLVTSLDDLKRWFDTAQSPLALHIETTADHYVDTELVGLSFCYEAESAIYVPLGHNYDGAPAQLSVEQVLDQVRSLLAKKVIIGHDLKYAVSVLANYNLDLRPGFDTMLASYVLNSVGSRHDIDDLSMRNLGVRKTQYEEIAGKGAKQKHFNEIDIADATPFAAEVADMAFRLAGVLQEKLKSETSLASVFEEIEMPVLSILSRVERNGVLLDSDLLEQQSSELDKNMRELEQQAHGLAGESFNLGSPKQIQDIFFNKLELPILKKTPKGQPSTAEPVLQELALDYPLPKVILEYRSMSKLKSTYTDQLPKQVHQTTGRVHTSYRQAVAATGRLSSTDPNLQNIPIRTQEGRRVRKAFVAPKGFVLVAADYSQIELRIMAHLSNDVGLVSAFNQELDIHKATAAEVFGVNVEDVKDFQRRNAKAINFGLIYGMSAFGLSRQLNITRGDAEEYISLYFERYPGVRNYMDRIRVLAAEQGFVETIFGRRLYLPEINAKNFQRRQAAERTAINAPMQGSAADIIKRAMITIDNWLVTTGMNARMIMQVHDELVFEVAEDSQEELVAAVSEHMEAAAELSIPLLVETGVGKNWDDAH